MNSDKSPGPDGFTAGFYKQFWEVVGGDVTDAILSFFEGNKLPHFVNSISLALIPKRPNAVDAKDYRPISCCNVIYKAISKVLANRLRYVLPELIDASQSAFIQGRLIGDNILLAHEMLRTYSRPNVTPRCAIKVDLMKAFDSIEWPFLLDVLAAMRFPPIFVGWIRECLVSAKMSVCLNGTLCGYFSARKGLRQGDPISPYLFVICMEVLSCLFAASARAKIYSMHPQCQGTQLTHLGFADDLIVFTKATTSGVASVVSILNEFKQLSGLHFNPEKSEIYVAGLPENTAKQLACESGFALGQLPFRYLGVPLTAGKLKAADCKVLFDKITSRITDWRSKILSYAGKIQLISSVVGGILQYWMSVFLLPKALLKDIEHLCNRFLWGKLEGGRCKVDWKLLARPKAEGGVGLKDFYSWNAANTVRHLWALIVRGGSLWVAWVYKYRIKRKTIWTVQHSNGSWIWKRILKMRALASAHVTTGPDGSALWDGATMPRFSVKRVWDAIRPRMPLVEWNNLVWEGWQLPSSRILCWLIMNDRLAVKEKMANWGLTLDISCVLCSSGIDSRDHIFFCCVYSKEILTTLLPEIANLTRWEDNIAEVCSSWTGKSNFMKTKRLLWCQITSDIWKERCRRVFEKEGCTAAELIRTIREKCVARVDGRLKEEELLKCIQV
ncbi:LINE-1 retrotransposable element ORF2 protein [Linum grandiflorum]